MNSRKLIWIPKGEKRQGTTALVCPPVPLDEANPERLWIINRFENRDIPPPIGMKLTHGDSAFLESKGNDWFVRSNHLIYRGNFSDGGCWAMLEYK